MGLRPASLGVLLLATAPAAQVQIQVFAHTDLKVVDRTIPAGTDITAGATLAWSNNHPTFLEYAEMRMTATPNSVAFDNVVFAFASSPPAIQAHAIRVRLTSVTPVEGTLRVQGVALAASAFRVDVRNDGTDELGSTLTLPALPDVYEETLTVPSTGIDVVIEASALASFPGYSSSSAVALVFSPNGTNVSRSGVPCGAELTARYWALPLLTITNRRFELAADQAPVPSHAFFVLGIAPQNVVIPPLGCVLRTDILVALPATVDPNGRAGLTLKAPDSLTAFDVLAQFLAATVDPQGNPVWRTSQAVRLRL